MEASSREFLFRLLTAPSVSGYEPPVQRVVRDYIGPHAAVETDSHGNVTAVVNPEGQPRVQFAGHCDQIGFLVQHIEDSGFLRFSGVGGHDLIIVVGQAVTVWTQDGPLPGVIARKPTHLLSQNDRTKVPEMHQLWIDTGLESVEAVRQRVRLGDPITYALNAHDLADSAVASPGLDNKVGVFAVMEAVRLLAAEQELSAGVYSVSTVQEEIGLRGARTSAYRIDPQVAIACDVTHCTDVPDVEKAKNGDIKLGKGPVITRGPNINPVVFDRLVAAAEEAGIPYQIEANPRGTGTDANAIQISRGGVATGLVSIPNRYMHSPVEVCHLDDIANAARLLAEFTQRLTPEVDFTP